jgi:hypothetical protein
LRRERQLAAILGGQRQPHSGALAGVFGAGYAGDVKLPSGLRIEAKARRDGWRQLYAWLANVDALALKADRKEWLLVIPLERLQEVARLMAVQEGEAA